MQVQAAVAIAWRANANQTHIGLPYCGFAVQSCPEFSSACNLGDELVEPTFDDRGPAGSDRRNLLLIHVNTDDRVTITSQTSCRNAADIAETEYTDSHSYLLKPSSLSVRGQSAGLLLRAQS